MKIKVIQNYRGKFNLLSPNEETLCFRMAIVDDNGNVIQDEKGVKAMIDYNHEDDNYIFDDPFEYISQVFDACFKDSMKWIGNGEKYKKQHLLFKKLYEENFDEIDANMVLEHKSITEKKIREMELEISKLRSTLDAETILYSNKIDSSEIGSYNSLRQKWIEQEEKKMNDAKDGTDTYNEAKKRIERYQSEIIPL